MRSIKAACAGVRFNLVLGLAFGALGCGAPAKSPNAPGASAAPAQETNGGKAPFDLDATMKREASGLTERSVKGPGWTVKVPGSAEPTVEPVEGVVVVEIPIAQASAVRCQVYGETVDAAGTLQNILKESSSRVEYRSVAPVGLRLLAGMPAAGVRAFYLTDVEGGKAAGHLQLAIHTSPERSLLCMLDDVGYVATFEQVSAAFFASFAPEHPAQNLATYTEVAKSSLDATDVGFSLTRLVPGEKPGERTLVTVDARFMPTSPKDIAFSDEYTVLKYNAKGQLGSGTWVEGEGGEVTLQMSLKREVDGKYTYSGKVSGKELSGTLSTPKDVVTSLQIASILKKKLQSGAPFSETLMEYHPSIDPLAALPVTYTHEKGAPPRRVVAKLGEITFTVDLDSDGLPETGWFDMGKRKLVIKRERVDGHL